MKFWQDGVCILSFCLPMIFQAGIGQRTPVASITSANEFLNENINKAVKKRVLNIIIVLIKKRVHFIIKKNNSAPIFINQIKNKPYSKINLTSSYSKPLYFQLVIVTKNNLSVKILQ